MTFLFLAGTLSQLLDSSLTFSTKQKSVWSEHNRRCTMADTATCSDDEAQPLTNPSSNAMNANASVSARSRSAPLSPCPCCIILPADLFLPTSIHNTPPSNFNSNSNTTSSNISSISNNNTGESASLTDNERSDLTPQHVYHELVEKSVSTGISIQIVDTHCHAHLERPSEEANEQPSFYHCNVETEDASTSANKSTLQLVSLTCAVEPSDWSAALAYAAQSPYRIAAIGIHPWYLAGAEYDPDHPDHPDRDQNTESTTPSQSQPQPQPPIYIQNLEQILRDHPHAAVGEIGLCKMARWTRQHAAGKQAALAIQKNVFAQQLRLAAQYQRPATIHCVDQQKVLLEVLKEQQQQAASINSDGDATDTNNSLPPAMALHSFSGTAHQIEQLLKWEASLSCLPSKKASSSSQPTSQPPLLYFGFSHAINCAMSSSEKSRRQGRATIRAVPPNRLLAESDLHRDTDVLGGTVAAVAYLAWALDESVEAVAERTARNGLRFLHCLLDRD
jgi:Tat protein secretion system quality control protein TatD with DNase activity